MKKCANISLKTNGAVVNDVSLVYSDRCNGFWATFTYGCFYLPSWSSGDSKITEYSLFCGCLQHFTVVMSSKHMAVILR